MISLITTTLNEGKNIEDFLKSLFSQTKIPDELLIVDGGSTDNTLPVISNFKFQIKNKKIRFKFLKKMGNRSIGRNEAIKHAKGNIIVCTDVGCLPDKNWIKNIVEPFKNMEVSVVAGYYEPEVENIFEKSLATYTCVMPDKVEPNDFLPSSRSVAFKKSAWEKVGGYPEWLNTCEDLFFARELKRKGLKFAFAKNAIVFWPQRKNIFRAFFQFFNYALGDGIARYFRKTTPLLYGRYALVLILLIIFIQTRSVFFPGILISGLALYLIWSIFKNYKYVRSFSALFYLPLLQLVSDIAVLSGMSLGLLLSLSVRKNV